MQLSISVRFVLLLFFTLNQILKFSSNKISSFSNYVSPSNEGRHIVLVWFLLLLPLLLSEACPDHNFFVFRDRSIIFHMWVHDHKAVCRVPQWPSWDLDLWPQDQIIVFSSPGPKVHVNYCHHLASVVCRLSSVVCRL